MTDDRKRGPIDRGIDEALREMTASRAPADLPARIARGLDDRRSSSAWTPRLLPAAGIACVVVALAASLVFLRGPSKTGAGNQAVRASRVQAPDADRHEEQPRAARAPEMGGTENATTPGPRHERGPATMARVERRSGRSARASGRAPVMAADRGIAQAAPGTAVRAVILVGAAKPDWGQDPFAAADVPASTPLAPPPPVVVAPLGVAPLQVAEVGIQPIELPPVDQSQPPSPLPQNERGRHENENRNPGR